MASGSYARKTTPQEPEGSIPTQSRIPQRATRQLREVRVEEEEQQESQLDAVRLKMGQAVDTIRSIARPATPLRFTASPRAARVVDEFAPHPLERHKSWLTPFLICMVIAIVFAGVLLSASMMQREDSSGISLFGGQVYNVQVGGTLAKQVENTNGPIPTKVALSTGPYSVLGPPTVSADFINRVLDSYGSPAAGKGQTLYDLGVKYGIDPVYALAFFLHESSMGTTGEARVTLSLGNERCIPDRACIDQDRGGYAQMLSWEDGFEHWYKLIRNLYVAIWGRSTVDQIIPKYAPASDNNDEAAYIAALKYAVDTWRSGQVRV